MKFLPVASIAALGTVAFFAPTEARRPDTTESSQDITETAEETTEEGTSEDLTYRYQRYGGDSADEYLELQKPELQPQLDVARRTAKILGGLLGVSMVGSLVTGTGLAVAVHNIDDYENKLTTLEEEEDKLADEIKRLNEGIAGVEDSLSTERAKAARLETKVDDRDKELVHLRMDLQQQRELMARDREPQQVPTEDDKLVLTKRLYEDIQAKMRGAEEKERAGDIRLAARQFTMTSLIDAGHLNGGVAGRMARILMNESFQPRTNVVVPYMAKGKVATERYVVNKPGPEGRRHFFSTTILRRIDTAVQALMGVVAEGMIEGTPAEEVMEAFEHQYANLCNKSLTSFEKAAGKGREVIGMKKQKAPVSVYDRAIRRFFTEYIRQTYDPAGSAQTLHPHAYQYPAPIDQLIPVIPRKK